MDRQPPTNHELLEYVMMVLENSDLRKITMEEVCDQVYSHYSDFDLEDKKEYIRNSVNRIINNTVPITAQAENLVNNDLETCQKWEAVANDLDMLEEAASRAPQFWAGPSSHGRTQQLRFEEEENEETPAELPKTPEKQDASQATEASDDDVDAESTGDVPQSEEDGCASIYCKNRNPAAIPLAMRFIGGKIPKRRRRQMIRTTPTKVRPLTVLQRMIRLEERHLSLTRDNAIALNHVADSVDRLADFITECSHRIAGDIARRNTPN